MKTLTLGEFRERTKDLDDSTLINLFIFYQTGPKMGKNILCPGLELDDSLTNSITLCGIKERSEGRREEGEEGTKSTH